eukprot:scaffold1070_cov245-Pinguiococcus_pyrenoidosus.AAC.29
MRKQGQIVDAPRPPLQSVVCQTKGLQLAAGYKGAQNAFPVPFRMLHQEVVAEVQRLQIRQGSDGVFVWFSGQPIVRSAEVSQSAKSREVRAHLLKHIVTDIQVRQGGEAIEAVVDAGEAIVGQVEMLQREQRAEDVRLVLGFLPSEEPRGGVGDPVVGQPQTDELEEPQQGRRRRDQGIAAQIELRQARERGEAAWHIPERVRAQIQGGYRRTCGNRLGHSGQARFIPADAQDLQVSKPLEQRGGKGRDATSIRVELLKRRAKAGAELLGLQRQARVSAQVQHAKAA